MAFIECLRNCKTVLLNSVENQPFLQHKVEALERIRDQFKSPRQAFVLNLRDPHQIITTINCSNLVITYEYEDPQASYKKRMAFILKEEAKNKHDFM